MSENPYESPHTPPERNSARRRIVLVVLALLAVPAAGVAGAATCIGTASTVRILDRAPWIAVLCGLAPTIAILCALDYAFPPRKAMSPLWAILALVLATPVALMVAGLIGAPVVLPARPPPGVPYREAYLFAASWAAFTIWGAGFWIGARGWLREFGKWLRK